MLRRAEIRRRGRPPRGVGIYTVALAAWLAATIVGCGGPSNVVESADGADLPSDGTVAEANNETDNPVGNVTPRERLELGRTAEYDYDPPIPGSYDLPMIKPAGDGPVLRLDGKAGRLRELMKGRITVLSFIYTRCADPTACPYALSVLHKIRTVSEQDPVIANNLRLMTFSFDPDHDKPHVLSDYTEALRQGGGSEWTFLTAANSGDLSPILKLYGQQVDRREDPNHPLGPFSHLLRVYLIDRHGMIRNIYSTGMLDPRLVLADVRTLILEERQVLEESSGSGSEE